MTRKYRTCHSIDREVKLKAIEGTVLNGGRWTSFSLVKQHRETHPPKDHRLLLVSCPTLGTRCRRRQGFWIWDKFMTKWLSVRQDSRG